MEDINQNTQEIKKPSFKKKFKGLMKKSVPLSMVLLITFSTTFSAGIIQNYFYKGYVRELLTYIENPSSQSDEQLAQIRDELLPVEGVVLPVKWGDIGKKLVDTGVIDQEKYLALFKGGPLSSKANNYEAILAGNYDENIVLTQENSRFVLNTLWALGLAQQSDVLASMLEEYPQVDRLAATGGWTLGKSNAMDYYGKFNLLDLNAEQQSLVKEITQNIYRPCCNNHTAFADCNHGAAMLGLVEMMVSDGYSEDDIYDTALAANTMWFPDTYLTIAKYMEDERDLSWSDVDSKEVLGRQFSSGSGFKSLLAKVSPVKSSGGGGGCGV